MLFQLGLFGEGSRCFAEWAGEEFPLRSDRRQRIVDGLEGYEVPDLIPQVNLVLGDGAGHVEKEVHHRLH